MPTPTPARQARQSTRKRLLLLVALAAAGWLVGAAGSVVSGNALWYCAIPAAVALGWLFVADPSRCDAPGRCSPRVPQNGGAGTHAADNRIKGNP